ncbi:hypothetical protein [Acrocarpospora catenulata]|uniref:hypothetical protein n=1 Tax=Acrocarpospora catenulata TaxID=2836182 RepID=UPI001BD9C75F|nr:hypothetical protein [Acrocarpospora catenulata]
MGGSGKTAFTIVCAAALATVLPGFAGYASAKFEAYDQSKLELARLRAHIGGLTELEQATRPAGAPCSRGDPRRVTEVRVRTEPIVPRPRPGCLGSRYNPDPNCRDR